ncbi:MAG: DUF4328 domain-containing protein [bacterium]
MVLSKKFYLGSYLGGIIGGFILMFIAGAIIAASGQQPSDGAAMGAGLFYVLGLAVMLYAAIVTLVFVYKMWKAIQPANPRTTPGKAVGFLFIPIFNFYWIFVAFHGYTKDFNNYVGRPALPENLALAYCILVLVSIIPLINFITSIAVIIIFALLISKICDAVNQLGASAPAGGQMPQPPAQ